MSAFGILFISLVLLLLNPPNAYAKRVVYLPVMSSSIFGGTYDGSSADPNEHKYCYYSNNIFERISGSAIGGNKRTSGLYNGLGLTLRNTSMLKQTVTVVIENINFRTGFWKNNWMGIPDEEFLKNFNNSNAGYKLTFSIAPYKTQVVQFEYGCQGETSSNNCWLYQKPLLQGGSEIIAGKTFFGQRGSENNLTSWNKYICYELRAVTRIRLEVAEDAGALIGAVYTEESGSVTGIPALTIMAQGSFEINNGRSF